MAEEHGLPQSVGETLHPSILEDIGDHKVFYKYLRLLPCGRQRRRLALGEYTILSFATVYVRFFSRLSDRLMRHRVDKSQLNHCISEHS